VQIVAVALTIGLLLMLMTGLLVYVVWQRGTARVETKESPNERERMNEASPVFLAGREGESTGDADLETLKAKLDVQPASTSSRTGSEVDVLKAKRGKTTGPVEADGPEVATLKAKLAGSVTTTEERASRTDLKVKPAERGVPPEIRPRKAAGTASKR
jgi:hypothetical protein